MNWAHFGAFGLQSSLEQVCWRRPEFCRELSRLVAEAGGGGGGAKGSLNLSIGGRARHFSADVGAAEATQFSSNLSPKTQAADCDSATRSDAADWAGGFAISGRFRGAARASARKCKQLQGSAASRRPIIPIWSGEISATVGGARCWWRRLASRLAQCGRVWRRRRRARKGRPSGN